MQVGVETRFCRDCGDLVDVVIGRPPEVGPSGDPEFDQRLNVCPHCGAECLEAWEPPGECPRCGSQMSRGEMISIWD